MTNFCLLSIRNDPALFVLKMELQNKSNNSRKTKIMTTIITSLLLTSLDLLISKRLIPDQLELFCS